MDRIFTFITDLPSGINEIVTPCLDGFTVYISANLDHESRLKAFEHAVAHIARNDFESVNVQIIENIAHEGQIYEKKNI